MSAGKFISEQRLSMIEDILIASGWTKEPLGFLPPMLFQEKMRQDLGIAAEGHWSLRDAMSFQIQFDTARTK